MSRLADHSLDLAIRILPPQARRRYVAEFESDLRLLPATKQTPYAVSTLLGAPHLRWEILRAATGSGATACFVGLHHDRQVRTESVDPTVHALDCTRCGRVRDPRQYGSRPRTNDLRAWYSANGGS